MRTFNKEILSNQLKSIIVLDFLNLYNEFEKSIRNVFEEQIKSMSKDIINQLYFYYGGKIGTYIDNDGDAIKLTTHEFKKEEKFKQLTINQILKIGKKNKCIDKLDFEVQSIEKEIVIFDFYDCAIKILNMRNKLAHEIKDCNFNKDTIEILSMQNIEEYSTDCTLNYDLKLMDDMTKAILSNSVYIKIILKELENRSKD